MKPVVLLLLAVAVQAISQTPNQTTSQPPPAPEEQDHILDRMNAYADHYIQGMPNFLCEQTTRHEEKGPGAKKWDKGDTTVERLSYNAGKEQRTVETINGKRVKPGSTHVRAESTRLSTEGEFVLLLQSVLGKDGRATFLWSRWDEQFGRKLAVFDYVVDVNHSDLELSSQEGGKVKAVVAYHGSVWADPETGSVWRISDTTDNIPQRLQTRELSTVVDFGETTIGGTKYLLPVHATVTLVLWTRQVRHSLDFENYRKFEAQSTITFGSDAEPEKKP